MMKFCGFRVNDTKATKLPSEKRSVFQTWTPPFRLFAPFHNHMIPEMRDDFKCILLIQVHDAPKNLKIEKNTAVLTATSAVGTADWLG